MQQISYFTICKIKVKQNTSEDKHANQRKQRFKVNQQMVKLKLIIVSLQSKLKSLIFMNNRNNKSKRQSKLKHTVLQERFAVNSPAKFNTTNALSSGCCPKQPPNISYHHLQKKRQHEVKVEYYMGGKQNKGRIMNSGMQQKQQVSLIDRFREKRNTHHLISYQTTHSKMLQVKKPLVTTNYQSLNNQQTTFKSLQKSKPNTRNPITLGSMRNTKSKLLKQQSQKQNMVQKSDQPQKRKQLKQRISYAPQSQQCHLKCFQNLSSQSIAQSKVSTNYFAEITSLDESQIIVDKLPPNRKQRFHKSPQLSSPKIMLQSHQLQQQQKIKSPLEEIEQFNKKVNLINANFQLQSLAYMQNKDLEFVRGKNINCYLGNQIHLDWKKRAMVINWMIDVLAQIGGKRETLANAVNIFDRYLSLTLNIPLDHIQCTAVASLLISAKLQDKSLTASYLSQTTLNKYSTQQIMQQQQKIFYQLNYQVNNPTLNNWSNRLAVQWDIYLDTTNMDELLAQYEIIANYYSVIKFKNSDQTSYYNYRWLCQYIDFAIMDIYTLRYQPRMLSLAFIYIILVLRMNLATKEKVINVYSHSSQFLFEKNTFHQFFSKFLKDSFGQELIDLLPMIQYCATFVILPLRFALPEVIPDSNIDNEEEQVNYQNFCSYQTKNQQTLSSLYSRDRSIY